MTFDLATLDFAKAGGVVTVVTVDHLSGRVLMVARADRDAMERTLASGEMHYTSRTRGLWRKGATSGNVQRVVRLSRDCDGDAVLAHVVPAGPACHDGTVSCFRDVGSGVFDRLDGTIRERANGTPAETSYTRRLLDDSNLRLKKIGEEAAELVHALAVQDRQRSIEEAADLLYHSLVALHALGAGLSDVQAALATREDLSPEG